MIQRIQSVFLLLAALLNETGPFYCALWNTGERWFWASDAPLLLSLFLASGGIALLSLFLFKTRKWQFVLNRLNAGLNLLLLGLLVYELLQLPAGIEGSEKGIGLAIPLLSIALLVLANRGIKRDEDRVRSVDRIR